MKKVSFSMAQSGVTSKHLSVDAQLTEIHEATFDSPARISGDVCIYNGDGGMEICIEGLTVGSLASAHPSADRDLYLHTTYAPDPEDTLVHNCAILGDANVTDGTCDKVLEESCLRIQSFFEPPQHPAVIWPSDTEGTLDQHIRSSPYSLTLDKIRIFMKENTVKKTSADDTQSLLRSLLEEGRHAYQFQRQVASIVKQIAHKYPRMSIFSLTDSGLHMSTPILKGLASAFVSYTSLVLGPTDQNFDSYLAQSSAAVKRKVRASFFDQTDNIKEQLDGLMHTAPHQPFDLTVLSTSIFKQEASSEAVLEQVKTLIRPGGFLILIHMPIQMSRDRGHQSANLADAIITPPDWPDLLDHRGFMNPAIKNTDQHYPGGFSITVRQSESLPKKNAARIPSALSFAAPVLARPNERLLVVGGQTTDITSLAAHVGQQLSSHLYNPVTIVSGLDELADTEPHSLPSFTCAIVLSDLDDNSPILSSLDGRRLDTLRKVLLRPEMAILWVTKGARVGNSENAASYGFTRSIRAEMPSLFLQMLDFDHIDSARGQLLSPCQPNTAPPSVASVVANIFLQLMLGVAEKRKQDFFASLNITAGTEPVDHLWLLETEVFIDSTGQRLVPRMLPFEPSNEKFNASRRVVTRQVNTLSSCIELVHDAANNRYQINTIPTPFSSKNFQSEDLQLARIQVHYSSAKPLFRGHYVSIGQCLDTGGIIAAASKTNASFVSVPRNQLFTIPQNNDHAPLGLARSYVGALVGTLVCCQLVADADQKPLVFVAQDKLLLQCAKLVSSQQGHDIAAIHVTDAVDGAQKSGGSLSIHPRATEARMAATLYRFKDGAAFVNFLPETHAVSRFMSRSIPLKYTSSAWTGISGQTCDAPQNTASLAADLLQQAIAVVDASITDGSNNGATTDFVSVPSLLSSHTHEPSPLQIVDWRAERTVDNAVLPHENAMSKSSPHGPAAAKLRGDRTYVLIGITRDMGQSLSTLFAKQGARHIVLASRSVPKVKPQWAKHAKRVHGVDVRFEALDVTDLAAVQQFRVRVEQSMPRIGGIVNGAMVLDDRVFAQMTADTFSRVMRPKTVGSRNLDTVFRDDDEDVDNKLDVFIMTSSFAAVGGHAGQSNYAAANMVRILSHDVLP